MKKKIIKFLSGKYSNEGKAMYDAWYKSFDDSVENSISPVSQEQLEQELAAIKQSNLRTLSGTGFSFHYWRLAAAILILVVTGAVVYQQWDLIIDRIDPIQYTEQITPRGARLQLKLSDGSQVWLNAGTKFRYPEKFKRDAREVYLEGEAYFEVAKDSEHPFIIHSGQLMTTVLGTSFNIQAYTTEESMEIAVVTGKVSVEKESDKKSENPIILLPNQKAVLSKKSQQFTVHEFPAVEKYLAWKEGRLIADDLPVSNILQMLNRMYDATIEVENEALGKCHVTAEFEALPLERVLDFLCAILNTTYSQKEGGKYIIHGSRCVK